MPTGKDNTGVVNPGGTTTGEAGPTGGAAPGGTPGGAQIRKPRPDLFKPKPAADTGSGRGGTAEEGTGPDTTPSIIQADGTRTKPGANNDVISGGTSCQVAYDAVKESLSTTDAAGKACAFAEVWDRTKE